MGVPGNFAERAPAGLADTELFAVDAYRTTFDARVVEVDREGGRIRLDRTAFYPTGGGQPHDTGTLTGPEGAVAVTGVRRESGLIWHAVAADPGALPEVGTEVGGEVDWSATLPADAHPHGVAHPVRRHLGGPRHPGDGRQHGATQGPARLPLPGDVRRPRRPGRARINDEIERAHEIVVDFLPRDVADADPALIRTAAHLIPAAIDPLRIIDIVGLDRQADGGTHVLSTAEVGRVKVTGTESKGKDNKRIRLEVVDA